MSSMSLSWTDDRLTKAYRFVSGVLLEADQELDVFQREGVSYLFDNHNVCVNVGAGLGKSMIAPAFCLAMVFLGLVSKGFISLGLVPLERLGAQFVRRLRAKGLSAAQYGTSADTDEQIRRGQINFVFISPEFFNKCLSMLRSKVYQDNLLLWWLDEFDQLIFWGDVAALEEPLANLDIADGTNAAAAAEATKAAKSAKKKHRPKGAFRPQFAQIGVGVSLLPPRCRRMIATGTATKANQATVLTDLSMHTSFREVFVPMDRVNMCMDFRYSGSRPTLDELVELARNHSAYSPCPIVLVGVPGRKAADSMYKDFMEKLYTDDEYRSYLTSIVGRYTGGQTQSILDFYDDELDKGKLSRVRILFFNEKMGRGMDPKHVDHVILWEPVHAPETSIPILQ
jgi:hypothetical protein